jgi:endonuclease V-like protein UPF0215 family
MKEQIRVLGIDDSPFRFSDGRSLVVGAVVRLPNYLEAVMRTEVEVDGDDATGNLAKMISGSRYRDQVKVVMLDGISLAGFNVVDVQALHESIGIPVLTVTMDPPDLDGMRAALKKHFPDWERRYGLITRLELRRIPTEHRPVYASGVGLGWDEFVGLVGQSTVRGAVPEPLRMAHVIAAAMVKGESKGRP